MKTITAVLSLLMFSSVAAAQSPDPSKWMCRNLADSGGFTYQGETIFGTQACRPISQAAPTQIAASATATAPRQAAAPTTPVTSASNSAVTETTSAPLQAPAPATPAAAPAAPLQQNTSPCVVLKRMGPADEITSHFYAFGVRGKQFQFVEGDLPKGVDFHGRLTDHDVRNIENKGGKVVVIEPKYTTEDLDHARKECHEQ